jgi:hypothetical protein
MVWNCCFIEKGFAEALAGENKGKGKCTAIAIAFSVQSFSAPFSVAFV